MKKKSKHQEKLDRIRVRVVNVVGFLMGFSQSVLAYTVSTYFKESSGTENVGIFYFVINILMVLMTCWIVDEFTIDNFWWGLLFVLIYTVIASIIGMRNREE